MTDAEPAIGDTTLPPSAIDDGDVKVSGTRSIPSARPLFDGDHGHQVLVRIRARRH